ncbi:MAG: 23S rRNA (uracil(1939)-C(5))-methyltransferase RlmD [Clostridia bacterium]|nr:23S rRNA (uracil(1939)-C(5))-methyltransferase RlmD [Clostridia bacterium]
MLESGQAYTVTIEECNIFANGVCHIDNMVVFVPNTLQGEECEITITKVMPTYAFARCDKIISPSNKRQVPACKVYNECGGCSFLHMNIEEENYIKNKYVKNAFKKQKIEADFEKTVSPVCEKYRNKVVLFFDGNDFGYMKEGTNQIVKHHTCNLNPDVFDKIASFTKEHIKSNNLRALYLRKSSHSVPEIMVCPIFYKSTDISTFVKDITNEFPQIKSILVSSYEKSDFALEKLTFKAVYGNGYINDEICGVNFRISPESFYQINHPCATLLYEKAIELADAKKGTLCADLFCGTGTIGIIIAKKTGAEVNGVEIVKSAVEDARFNATQNGIANATFEACDAKAFNKKTDVCIIDPPRKGCSQLMLNTLLRLKPKRIVYVSCNTDTLTRDLKILLNDYKISSPVSVFNMFPRTKHVESVVCLTRE